MPAAPVVRESDYLLMLVRMALDEFDDRKLDVTVRRTIRIANLLGETQVAIRLGFEVSPLGGDREANAEDVRRLMTDASQWGTPTGPHEAAVNEFLGDRRLSDDKEGQILGWSLSEIDSWLETFDALEDDDVKLFSVRLQAQRAIGLARHRAFTALCKWERVLSYSNVNERIFERFRSVVDRKLADGSPELLDRFNAVYRRLRDAVAADPEQPLSEELSQAVTSCRRILKGVVDHVLPGEPGKTSEGHALDDSKYRNRLVEFVKGRTSEKYGASMDASFGGLLGRFDTLDDLAHRGVHATTALYEAEYLAISTYLIAGEILRIQQSTTS